MKVWIARNRLHRYNLQPFNPALLTMQAGYFNLRLSKLIASVFHSPYKPSVSATGFDFHPD